MINTIAPTLHLNIMINTITENRFSRTFILFVFLNRKQKKFDFRTENDFIDNLFFELSAQELQYI